MLPVLVFRHAPAEGPGTLAGHLEQSGVPHRLVAVDRGEEIPADLDDASGLVFLGGPMSVNDPLPWVAREVALIRRALETRRPVLGICLGAQLVAAALGAVVRPNPVQEIGWFPVRKAEAGAANRWHDGLAETFEAFHWHGETFDLPADAALLWTSAACPHQAFAYGNALALQFHVEMTAAMVWEWATAAAETRAFPATVQSPAQMCERLDERVGRLREVAGVLYDRWLQLL
ncbi:MAG: type 1 glutamine amidotransferase [Acidobacteria bacterium]|nr:type 1 glutamine amidotransferase [Acidobacteriota bacterium]